MRWVAILLALAVLMWPAPLRPWSGRVDRPTSGSNLRTVARPAGGFGPRTAARPRVRLLDALPITGRRRTHARRAAVTGLLRSLQPAVRAGVPPAVALGEAALLAARDHRDDPAFAAALGGLAEAAAAGVDLPEQFQRIAATFALPELDLMAASWALSEDLGCSLAVATATAARLFDDQQQRERAVQVAIAGPRVTMHLLTGLPAAGVGIAALAGVAPTRLYSGVVGVVALATGAVLLLLGRWWANRLIRRAVRSPGLA